jgi:hypothetical protein
MASTSLLMNESFDVSIHRCSKADLEEWAKKVGAEIELVKPVSGDNFETVEFKIGKVRVVLFT